MKKIALAVAGLIGSASAALAGGLSPALIETDPVVIEESSRNGLLIPLILLALLAAAMSKSGGTVG